MNNKGVTKKYARALYNVAVQKDDVKQVSNRINYIVNVMRTVPEFSQLLQTHQISDDDKITILKNILHENTVPIVIQINGKKRGLIEAKRDICEVDLLELIFKNKNLEKYLVNKEVRKKIYVKNRLINIIV